MSGFRRYVFNTGSFVVQINIIHFIVFAKLSKIWEMELFHGTFLWKAPTIQRPLEGNSDNIGRRQLLNCENTSILDKATKKFMNTYCNVILCSLVVFKSSSYSSINNLFVYKLKTNSFCWGTPHHRSEGSCRPVGRQCDSV